MRTRTIIFILVFGTLFLMNCAVEQAPLGGPPDETGPQPDSLRSTANEQVFFTKQDIEIAFDEWVTLKNPSQIMVSPPLEYKLKPKLKKKSLILEFDEDEELYENTTYTINLGQSIVDYSASNPISNYTFVFSTGSFIDSLSLKGVVKDDFTGEAMEGVIVSVYANLQDSAFFTERPLYFTRTNGNGQFEIQNMRSDSFSVFAIEDKNGNFYKDQESEGMAYADDIVYLDTSFRESIALGFYKPTPAPRFTSKTIQKGRVLAVLNRVVDSLNFSVEPAVEHQYYLDQDTVFFWYKGDIETSLILETNPDKTDTLSLLNYMDSIAFDSKMKLRYANVGGVQKLHVSDTLELTFRDPVSAIDLSKFFIKDSSEVLRKLSFEKDLSDSRKIKAKEAWKEGLSYTLYLYPGALTNFFGESHDTIRHQFSVSKQESLGEIVFELDSLQSEYQYIVELGKGGKTISRKITGVERGMIIVNSLETGTYTVRVIQDVNRNGRWDPGDFDNRLQSEKWISKSLESLKAGWTLEVLINGQEFGK